MEFQNPQHLVETDWLQENLDDPNLRIIDCTVYLPNYFDETADESEHFSQIPEGFAGELSEHDNDRADASAWLDPIPVIREFSILFLSEI